MERPSLTARFRSIDDISPGDILAMHALFAGYYENASIETFIADLSKKSGAILVHEKGGGPLRGFSTVTTVALPEAGEGAIGVFSGDTILHHEYWGDRSLKDGFVRYMLKLKLSNPLRRVYWLLISKGYKTYLLMAKNFVSYYPRHDRPNDPKLERLVRAYCDTLFPGKYDAKGKVLDFGETSQKLRGEVAPITTQDRLREPAIRYFEARNPEWERGVELPCIGEVSFSLLMPYLDKQRRRSSTPPALTESESFAAMAHVPNAEQDARSVERVWPRAGGMS